LLHPVYAIADDDLVRENNEKASAVHFVRFELTPSMKTRLRDGAGLHIGCDHSNYPVDMETVSVAHRRAQLSGLR
jgi:hypothetical protein